MKKRKQGNTIFLSIAFNHHDSNVALSIDDVIVASLELERLFRAKKISASITHMEIAARFLLEKFNFTISDVDYLVVNALNNPFENSTSEEDIRENEYAFLGRNIPTFILRHHLAHAGHYYFSNFSKALIASCDGGGDLGERVVYFIGDNLTIQRLLVNIDDHISTKPYGQFASYLYGEPFSEGKLMGLAGLSFKVSDVMLKLVSEVFPRLKNVDFVYGQTLLKNIFKSEQNLAKKDPLSCASLASAIQSEFVKRRVQDIKKVYRTKYENIVLCGGSALNLGCNSKIFEDVTKSIYISPNCDDTGIAIGQIAIIIAKEIGKRPRCKLPYLGINESSQQFELTKKGKEKIFEIENEPQKIAMRLSQDEIGICHIGRAEVGPRALGHRSFLISPLQILNKERISVEIKQRESYRPVAPIILEEDLQLYFQGGPARSPYMMFNYIANEEAQEKIPAVVHTDGTSRVQTVNKDDESFLRQILTEFKKITGIGVLINTSLNLNRQPITNFVYDTFEIARKINAKLFICSRYEDI